MTWRPPEPLAVHHRLEGFDCTNPTLNHWLQHHARQAQTSGSARTFVVADEENHVSGYFSLTVGQVDTVEAPERIRQGMGRFPLPVVILARLAVSRENQGRGLGVGMLQDYAFKTPSQAAGLLLARSANGRLDWMDAAGITLKEHQERAAAAASAGAEP